MSECPACKAEVEIAANVSAGELVLCANCGSELELLETNPVKLTADPSAVEDWADN
jgi:alpha-aminoadipate/glutamate carrier protein LysW